MGGGAEAEQICFTCISLVNERAVLNPQSIHSLAKIFALVELPSNGGEYANDQVPWINEMQCLCGKLKGARLGLAQTARVCNLLGTSGSWTEPLRSSHFPCNIKDDREEP